MSLEIIHGWNFLGGALGPAADSCTWLLTVLYGPMPSSHVRSVPLAGRAGWQRSCKWKNPGKNPVAVSLTGCFGCLQSFEMRDGGNAPRLQAPF